MLTYLCLHLQEFKIYHIENLISQLQFFNMLNNALYEIRYFHTQ